jgi:ferredoxin
MFAMPRRVRFTEAELREAIDQSRSWAETLRRLGYRSAGGNWKTLQKYAALWAIDTDHFDPDAVRRESLQRSKTALPLEEVLVENSTYDRGHVKRRLFAEGLKPRRCELCGQDEIWRGRRMALILDHINGIPNDNRLENLRIVCPNCAATFETHCARKNRVAPMPRRCLHCGSRFFPNRREQRYCSRACGVRWDRSGRDGHATLKGVPKPAIRRVERPPYEQLMAEIEETSYLAVGRKHGVSDNAIRKWVRFYESELARLDAEGEPLDEAA